MGFVFSMSDDMAVPRNAENPNAMHMRRVLKFRLVIEPHFALGLRLDVHNLGRAG